MTDRPGRADVGRAGAEVRPMLHLKFDDPELVGTLEELPGLLMARINRRRPGLAWAFRLTVTNGCALFVIFGAGPFVPEESSLGFAVVPLLLPVFLHPILVLCWANTRLSPATEMARWLSREAMADEVLSLPIPGQAWAFAQCRLFVHAAVGGLGALAVPFAPIMFQSTFPDPRPILLTLLGVVVALNWAIYWVVVAGGRGPRVALAALLGFYPAMFGIGWFGNVSLLSRPIALAAESILSNLWTLGAFTAWALAIGAIGFRRSSNGYPSILRDRVEALPAAHRLPTRP